MTGDPENSILCGQCTEGHVGLRLPAKLSDLVATLIAARARERGDTDTQHATEEVLMLLDRAMGMALTAALSHVDTARARHPAAEPGDAEATPESTSRTYLDTSDGMAAYAMRFGASFDPHEERWYVDGEVPGALIGLVPQVPRDLLPPCPTCGGPMALRIQQATQMKYFGCRHFPVCRGTLAIEPSGTDSQRANGFTNDLSRMRHLVVTGATAAFGGDGTLSATWLSTPHAQLDGKAPLKMLATAEGAQRVLTLIEAIPPPEPPLPPATPAGDEL